MPEGWAVDVMPNRFAERAPAPSMSASMIDARLMELIPVEEERLRISHWSKSSAPFTAAVERRCGYAASRARRPAQGPENEI